MRRIALAAGVPMALAALLAACASGDPIDFDEGPTPGGATLTTTLSALITGPWTNETCNSSTGCHQGPTPAGVVSLGGGGATPQQVHTSLHSRPGVVNTTNAAASVLLTDPVTGVPAHSGGQLWATGDASYQGTLRWIEQGAQNN